MLRTLTSDEGFRFFTGPGKYTGVTAYSTEEFLEKLQIVPNESVTFHFKNQDFQKWFYNAVGDEKLSQTIGKVKTTLQGEDLRQELLKKVQTRINELKMTPEDINVAWRVAAYTIGVLVVITYFFVGMWPSKTEDIALNTTRQVIILGQHFPMGAETSLVFIMLFTGIIGACVFSLFAISHHLGVDRDFDKAWQAWYLLRPLVGGGLALIFYLVVRGGVLSNLTSVNLVGLAAVTGLVGMFAEHAMHKLQDVADSLFGTAPDTAKAPAGSTNTQKTNT